LTLADKNYIDDSRDTSGQIPNPSRHTGRDLCVPSR
jgi:hypothetical protein